MSKKKLTDKQLIYTFNVIIIPHIEYLTQLSHLSETLADWIIQLFRALLKKKLYLSRDTPSCFIHSKLFYDVTHLYYRYTQALSDALLTSLNDTGLLGLTIRIQLLQLQLDEWLHVSPLVEWPYKRSKHFNNWILVLLCDLRQFNIKLFPWTIYF